MFKVIRNGKSIVVKDPEESDLIYMSTEPLDGYRELGGNLIKLSKYEDVLCEIPLGAIYYALLLEGVGQSEVGPCVLGISTDFIPSYIEKLEHKQFFRKYKDRLKYWNYSYAYIVDIRRWFIGEPDSEQILSQISKAKLI
jgi:hypothetical protein